MTEHSVTKGDRNVSPGMSPAARPYGVSLEIRKAVVQPMTRTPDPIQELVTAARRKQILDAATQVFAEKGFHRATIKEIARVAGIADGTIYTYFVSKTEVLLGILHRL